MSQCAVCNKRLRSPESVARGTGPTCAKNVARFIQALQSNRAGQAWGSWAQLPGAGRVGVDQMAIANARAQFLARIRRQRAIPIATGQVETALSSTRGQVEPLNYEQFENGAILAHSRSGNDYVITTDATGHPEHCSCPDHQFRRRECRHMQSYGQLRESGSGNRGTLTEVESERSQAPSVHAEPAAVEGNRLDQAPQILLSVMESEASREPERDLNLQAWAERHAHDNVFMSKNDELWRQIQVEAQSSLGEYETESALDGIQNTFGIELEVEGVSGDDLARALHQIGLSTHRTMLGYSTSVESGSWAVKRDGSLTNGAEVVSPILRDTPETWAAIQKVTDILKRHGARTNRNTGFHIHMGHDVLDDRGYRWQRLGKYMVGFEDAYLRMGAANQPDGVTAHRGTHYTQPLQANHVRRLSRHDDATDAARKIIGYRGHDSRYKMINTAKFIENNVPTVEFRYPNGTIDKVVVQRQVQLANATLMQAAYLRKSLPGANRLPALFQTDEGVQLSINEEMRFRQFLDTLGSHRLRLIATQLWMRGRVR